MVLKFGFVHCDFFLHVGWLFVHVRQAVHRCGGGAAKPFCEMAGRAARSRRGYAALLKRRAEVVGAAFPSRHDRAGIVMRHEVVSRDSSNGGRRGGRFNGSIHGFATAFWQFSG